MWPNSLEVLMLISCKFQGRFFWCCFSDIGLAAYVVNYALPDHFTHSLADDPWIQYPVRASLLKSRCIQLPTGHSHLIFHKHCPKLDLPFSSNVSFLVFPKLVNSTTFHLFSQSRNLRVICDSFLISSMYNWTPRTVSSCSPRFLSSVFFSPCKSHMTVTFAYHWSWSTVKYIQCATEVLMLRLL